MAGPRHELHGIAAPAAHEVTDRGRRSLLRSTRGAGAPDIRSAACHLVFPHLTSVRWNTNITVVPQSRYRPRRRSQVSARCFAGRPYQIITNNPSGGPYNGTAGAKGAIKRSVGVNLTSASAVSIQCLSIGGDGVSETFDVN